MIPVAAGVRIWIASGHTDMRKGMNGLALLVQDVCRKLGDKRGLLPICETVTPYQNVFTVRRSRQDLYLVRSRDRPMD